MSQNSKSSGKPSKGVEITLLAHYERPSAWGRPNTPQGDAAEIAVMKKKNWYPGTVDFEEIAETPHHDRVQRTEIHIIKNFGEFIAWIQNDTKNKPRKKGSVSRVNLISHGSNGLYSCSGKIRTDGTCMMTLGNRSNFLAGSIDSDAVADFNNTKGTLRDDIRDKFAPDAMMNFFLCNGGAGKSLALLIDIAQAFHVDCKAFSKPVYYHPNLNATGTRIIERNITADGPSGTHGRGYNCRAKVPDKNIGGTMTHMDGRHMKPDKSVIKPNKKTP